MIHEEICTYEVAKLAKEKGFNEYEACSHLYEVDEQWYTLTKYNNAKGIDWSKSYFYAAPTQSLLQRWLREEKKYAIAVFWDMLSKAYYYEIVKIIGVLEIQVGEKYNYSNPKVFDTYELALEDALKYALENLI